MDKTTVKKVASLARLRVKEEEVATIAQELQSILGLVDTLSKVNTDAVAPMTTPSAGKTPLRPDTIEANASREQILANAPKSEEGFFVVPKVVE